MSFKDFFKRCLMEFFIITTCVTLAIAVLGLALDPSAKFGYEAFFSPLIFGVLSLVPSLVTYSQKELSFRQMLVRKLLQLVMLELELTIVGSWTGLLHNPAEVYSFIVTVFFVYLIVNLVSWQIDRKEAKEINRILKTIQGKK